jgi:recombination protein RecA
MMDFEYAFDAGHAEEMGLDIDNNFYLIRPLNAEDGFNMTRDLIDTGEVGLVILDSVTAMASKAAVEDAFSGFAGGKNAAVISMGIRMLLPYLYNNKCTLIVISQERANMNPMSYVEYKGTGGKSLAFYSSWSARVTRAADITDSNKALTGLEIRVKNTKNKVGIAKRDATLKLLFKGGIDSEEEYMNYLKTLGIIEQHGAYFSNPDWVADDGTVGMKVCGLDAVKDYLKNNPKLYAKVKVDVNTLITGYTVMDASSEELTAEEEALAQMSTE